MTMTRTERTYYLIFGWYSMSWSFLGPMYALFLLSRGLDLFQINVVLATYFIVSFLFDVPTGAIADLAGRKVSFLLSCAVRTGAFVMYYFAQSFTDCLIAEFVDAIGTTLANGALDAWAVDSMQAEGGQPADRFFARAQMLSRSLMIGSGLVSGYIATYNMALPWLVGAAGFGVTGVLALVFMREPPRAQQVGARPSFLRTMNGGLAAVRQTPVLLTMCILTVTIAFGVMPAHQLWAPRVKAVSGQEVWVIGWIWALLNVAAVIGSAVIPRMLDQFAREYVLCAMTLWRGVMLAIAALATSVYPVVAGLLLIEMGFGVSEPLVQAWMNEHIAPEQRATVLSVRSMSFTLGGAIGLVCIGWIARESGIPAAWLVSSVVLALSAPGYLLLGRQARRVATPIITPHGVTPAIPPALG